MMRVKKIKSMKRTLALLMAAVMTLTSFAAVSFAEESNGNVYEGQKSAKIICSNTDNFQSLLQYVTLEANTDYMLTAWSKGTGNPSMRMMSGDWSSQLANANLKGGTEWQETTVTFNSGSNTSAVFTLNNNPYGGNGEMYVDNVSLVKASDGTINLISDPGFEGDGTWSWNDIFVQETSESTVDSGTEETPAEPNENVYEGQKSVKIICSNTDNFQTFSKYVTLEANTDYILTAWSKGTGNPTIRMMSGDWSSQLANANLKGGTEWQETTVTFNSGSNTSAVFMLTNNPYGGNGAMYVDNVSLVKASDGTINLISDPGFEGDGTWSWNDIFVQETSGSTVDPGTEETPAEPNENVYEGYKSAKIICSNTDNFQTFLQYVTLEANTDYILTAWSKGTGNPSMRMMSGNWSLQLANANLKGGTVWQETTVTFNSGSNISAIFMLTNNPYGGNGAMYVDNVSLVKASDGTINLISNPGFEGNGTWSWNNIFVQETSEVEVVPGTEEIPMEENIINQPNGNDSLNLYAGHTSLAYSASDTEQTVSQSIDLKENTEYKVSFWLKSPDGIKINFAVKDSVGNSLISQDIEATASWVRHEYIFKTTDAVTALYEFNSISGQTGNLYIDYCMLVTKMRPVGMNMEQLLSDISFEDLGDAWSGINGAFSLYRRTDSTVGDVSGGVRIMTVGDSITAGVGSSAMVGGYKKALYDKYISEGANVSFVGPNGLNDGFPKGSGHAGNSGWRIDQVEEQIGTWINQYEPQVILLLIGTNDILQNNTSNNYAANAPERLESTIDIIMSADPSIKLYLASVTPLKNTSSNDLVIAYNAEVERIASTKGENVIFVDMYEAVTLDGISVDNVHPNDTGYEQIANKWFEETKDVVKTMTPKAFVADKGTAYDGKYSLKYNPYYVPNYTLLNWEIFSRGDLKLEPNTDYTLSMMVRGEQGVSLNVRLQGSWSGDIFSTNTIFAGPKWMKYEMKFNSGNRSTAILNLLNNCYVTGNMYIDCIELYKDGDNTNLISNSSFELDENGERPGWNNALYPFSYVEDTTEKSFDETVTITQNGKPVSSLTAGTVDIYANLAGIKNDGAVIVAALYENGILQKLSISDKTVYPTAELEIESVGENTSLTVFMFNSMKDIVPLLSSPITK